MPIVQDRSNVNERGQVLIQSITKSIFDDMNGDRRSSRVAYTQQNMGELLRLRKLKDESCRAGLGRVSEAVRRV